MKVGSIPHFSGKFYNVPLKKPEDPAVLEQVQRELSQMSEAARAHLPQVDRKAPEKLQQLTQADLDQKIESLVWEYGVKIRYRQPVLMQRDFYWSRDYLGTDLYRGGGTFDHGMFPVDLEIEPDPNAPEKFPNVVGADAEFANFLRDHGIPVRPIYSLKPDPSLSTPQNGFLNALITAYHQQAYAQKPFTAYYESEPFKPDGLQARQVRHFGPG